MSDYEITIDIYDIDEMTPPQKVQALNELSGVKGKSRRYNTHEVAVMNPEKLHYLLQEWIDYKIHGTLPDGASAARKMLHAAVQRASLTSTNKLNI